MSDTFAAQILETSPQGLASYAVTSLFERDPAAQKQFEPLAFERWRDFLIVLLRDLAAAMRLNEPELFATTLIWHRNGFEVQEVGSGHLVTAVECLRDVVVSEAPPNQAEAFGRYFERALGAFQRRSDQSEHRLDPAETNERLALMYLREILEGDRRRAVDMIVRTFDEKKDLGFVYEKILLPALREVGTMWHQGELSIAEEHFATETTRHAMSILLHRSESAPPNGKTIVTAAVSGNAHDIAIRVVSDMFEVKGWRVISLGSDIPASDVARGVAFFEADLVALSATLANQLPVLEKTIRAVRSLEPAVRTKVLVGGLAFSAAPELWKNLGADAYAANAISAPNEALQLLENGD